MTVAESCCARPIASAKQCKMCQFIVKQISSEPVWPADDEAVKEVRTASLSHPERRCLQRPMAAVSAI